MLKRLKEFIDIKGISVSAFERSIGMSNASFGKSLKSGGTIGCDKLENILKIYPELNLMWLVTGKGNMFDKEEPINTYNNNSSPDLIQYLREKDELIMKILAENLKLKAEIAALKKESKPATYRNVAEP